MLFGKRCLACRMTTGFFAVRSANRFSRVSRSAPLMIVAPIRLRHSFNRKAGVLENRRRVRLCVEDQHERLLLIYIVALGPRPLIDDRRSAGVEVERAEIAERIPRQRLQTRAQLEGASQPAGKSCSKSYDQLRLSIHRPAPFAGQSISNGAVVSRGSPSGTIGSENRAVTCRTCFTVPLRREVHHRRRFSGDQPRDSERARRSHISPMRPRKNAQIKNVDGISRRESDRELLIGVPPATTTAHPWAANILLSKQSRVRMNRRLELPASALADAVETRRFCMALRDFLAQARRA